MKRCVNKIFMLFTLLCLLTGLLSGCKLFTKRDDVIPEKLGVQEGLWLYHNNTRSRTDGTIKHTILKTVEYAEKSYGTDSFKIHKLIYLTHIKTIVYWLSVFDDVEEGGGEVEETETEEIVGDSADITEDTEDTEETETEKTETQILYRYSYKEKTGALLYTLPSSAFNSVEMSLTDSFLYVKAFGSGVLFDSSLELVGEDFIDCTLNKNLLYRFKKRNLEWYRDGIWNSCLLDYTRTDESYHFFYAGDYLYVFKPTYSSQDPSYYVQYVNLKTGEQAKGCDWLNQKFVLNNEFYILDRDSNDNPTTYSLYRVAGMEFTRVYSVTARMSCYLYTYCSDADYFYLEAEDPRVGKSSYHKMNRHTNEFQSSEKIKETDRRYFEITVGEYTFYQNERTYLDYIVSANCVYLYREKNGKKEAMQYKLSEDLSGFGKKYDVQSRLFYNDICEF